MMPALFRRALVPLKRLVWAALVLFLDILFPSRCLGCGADTTATRAVLCPVCLDSIPLHSAFFCPVCSGRVPDPAVRCHRPSFLATAAVSYDDPVVRELVHVLKYKGVRSAAVPLGTLIVRHLKLAAPQGYFAGAVVVPIPLSAKRKRERGYNQAEAIAKAVAEELRLPLLPDLLRRVRHTAPQTEVKSREERLKNILGSFAAENARGKSIILVDDVTTTGATMSEAVKTLTAAGARRVVAVAAARA